MSSGGGGGGWFHGRSLGRESRFVMMYGLVLEPSLY